MKKYFLSLFLWCIAAEVLAQIDPQLDIWVKASVIEVDRVKNTIYARKLDGAMMFSFGVGEMYEKKIKGGDEISVQFNNKKASIREAGHGSEELRFDISDPEMPMIHARDFIFKLAGILSSNKTAADKNKAISAWGLTTLVRVESNIVRACCKEKTADGIEFILPAGMTEESIDRQVYIFDDLVIVDKKYPMPPILVLPITGTWVDSLRYYDSTKAQVKEIWHIDDKKAARPNTSDSGKWEVKKINTKTNTGKLIISLPAGTAWDMTIYAAGSSKVISNTMLQTSFTLLPGSYDLEINHIWVRGVTIEKGNSTRLKTGVLNISNSNSWTLYDETKEKVLINSLSPQKRGLPVGKYKLTILGQDQDIEIKDGETVEY